MVKRFTLFLSLFASFTLNAQNINIPDDNFKQALVNNIEINTDGDSEVSKSEAADYKGVIDIYDQSISNLTGIEHFINITELDCSENSLTDLDVSKNTKLTSLYCSYNQLSNLDVSKNTLLTFLYCFENQIRNLDVSLNTLLTDLDCSYNLISQLDVSKNTLLTDLDCSKNQLNDLTVNNNIELTDFICKGNQISSLDVSHNTKLTKLATSNNQLSSLDIQTNTLLRILACSSNQISNMDISNNTKLEVIECNNNQLESLDLSSNKALALLYLSNNQLNDLNVNSNTELRTLNCADNEIRSLDISNNTNLSFLHFPNNKFPFSVLSKIKNYYSDLNYASSKKVFSPLTAFEVDYSAEAILDGNETIFTWYDSDNNVVNADFVNMVSAGVYKFLQTGVYYCKMTNTTFPGTELTTESITINEVAINFPDANFKKALVDNAEINTNGDGEISESEAKAFTGEINVYDKKISDLSGIEYFTKINILKCINNQLTELDVSQNTALTELLCCRNKLTQLDISKNTALTELSCYRNKLTLLDISKNTALTRLDCFENQINSLDVRHNTALTHLDCSGNQLIQLDVSKNTALSILVSYDNPLNTLDISKNTALTYLWANDNQFSTLNVSQNTALTRLLSNDNQISTLNLSQNKALTMLWCNNNQLSTLDLSQNTALTELKCNDNKFSLSEINKIKTHFTDLIYTSDKTIFTSLSKKVGETIDYSAEKEFNGTPTTFVWYSSLNATVDETYVTETDIKGIFKFLQEGTYYCKMVNATLSSSELQTEDITVRADDFINFPDANLKKALVDNVEINTNGDAEISESEADTFTGNVNVSSKEITDLTGINYFTNITTLDCCFNQLTNIDISNNTKLTTLVCSENLIENLDLSTNSVLETLYCNTNKLTELDLRINTKLKFIICNNNLISELNLNTNLLLQTLNCEYNQLNTLDLKQNLDLSTLQCRNNKISSLDISSNTSLSYISCRDNLINYLNIGVNFALNSLDCSHNNLEKISLDKCPQLEYLICFENQISELNISQNTLLKSLICEENKLKMLDLNQNPYITYLSCNNNELNSLNLKNTSELKSLNCINNQLTELDLRNNLFLEEVLCNSNHITDLYLGQHDNLDMLWCSYNHISNISINQLPNLTRLSCDNNQITDLDLSKSLQIKELICGQNKLMRLDISKNYQLQNLYCSENLFPFSELIKIKQNFPNLSYTAKDPIFSPIEEEYGYEVDYFSESLIEGKKTIFTWYNSIDNAVHEVDIINVSPGRFIFKKADLFYCKMTNESFPKIELRTNSITIRKKEQSITFGNLPEKVKVNDVLELVANASSEKDVSFEVIAGDAIITGKTIAFNNEGNVEIRAIQAGNNEFSSTEKSLSFIVNKKEQSITFGNLPEKVKVNDVLELVANASSEKEVSFEVLAGDAIITGKTITFNNEGNVEIRAIQAGNNEFSSTEKSLSFIVNKKEQSITFEEIPTVVKMIDVIELSATASSGLEVKFEVVSGNASISENKLSFSEMGFVEVKAIQEGNGEYADTEKIIEIDVSIPTGIEKVLETSTQFYPNPVETEMVIKFGTSEERTIRIFDLQGRLKLQKETSATSERLNLSEFKSGMYLMKVQAKNESFTYKIIKK